MVETPRFELGQKYVKRHTQAERCDVYGRCRFPAREPARKTDNRNTHIVPDSSSDKNTKSVTHKQPNCDVYGKCQSAAREPAWVSDVGLGVQLSPRSKIVDLDKI